MAFLSFLTYGQEPLSQVLVLGSVVLLFLTGVFLFAFVDAPKSARLPEAAIGWAKFFYACFLKPHDRSKTGSQQEALESFYKAQAAAYDATRTRLLHGREEMLAMVAAQLKAKKSPEKPIWVDIGGGTGWNIEQMGQYLPVETFFDSVFLVDFSPSLCEIAKARFARLGWSNVQVICKDARCFRLEDYQPTRSSDDEKSLSLRHTNSYTGKPGVVKVQADVITMSYSLSMIPEFYPVIDGLSSLLSNSGIIGVCDFYVQSQVDYSGRNYTGGIVDRHCTFLSRTFWRAWFEIDRVNLEGARRDYLEYRFGTKLSVNARNHLFGVKIPYYIWIGCAKESPSMAARMRLLDAQATESPFLSALDLQSYHDDKKSATFESRSKAYESAIVNLSDKLPLPCFWYQNENWRIFYDASLQKHTQFGDEYIYAFTWEDSRVDARLLKVNQNDVIFAITSAGDNILSLALEQPKRIHAVDLNPNQNHLLELKVAAFRVLSYQDIWQIFGEGKHPNFRNLLIHKLSPHMSSYAFQYWLSHGDEVFGRRGLYYTGGSRHAILLISRLFRLLNLQGELRKLCEAPTLAEQKEIWHRSLRKVVLSRLISWTIISSEKWLWKALGVPPQQRECIEADYALSADASSERNASRYSRSYGHAIWEYVVNTLDPVAENTLLRDDNHYYLVTLQGRYSQRAHPDYLKPTSHAKLSAEGALDGLRIHTDEIQEVISRMTPGSLTIAIVMDSMDWFDESKEDAPKQIRALNRALAPKGRVLLRSAGLKPWYLKKFEENGFSIKCHGSRVPGTCIDRVNMYASCWICTKVSEVGGMAARGSLADLSLGMSAMDDEAAMM